MHAPCATGHRKATPKKIEREIAQLARLIGNCATSTRFAVVNGGIFIAEISYPNDGISFVVPEYIERSCQIPNNALYASTFSSFSESPRCEDPILAPAIQVLDEEKPDLSLKTLTEQKQDKLYLYGSVSHPMVKILQNIALDTAVHFANFMQELELQSRLNFERGLLDLFQFAYAKCQTDEEARIAKAAAQRIEDRYNAVSSWEDVSRHVKATSFDLGRLYEIIKQNAPEAKYAPLNVVVADGLIMGEVAASITRRTGKTIAQNNINLLQTPSLRRKAKRKLLLAENAFRRAHKPVRFKPYMVAQKSGKVPEA